LDPATHPGRENQSLGVPCLLTSVRDGTVEPARVAPGLRAALGTGQLERRERLDDGGSVERLAAPPHSAEPARGCHRRPSQRRRQSTRLALDDEIALQRGDLVFQTGVLVQLVEADD
jgi:hypothetical protein